MKYQADFYRRIYALFNYIALFKPHRYFMRSTNKKPYIESVLAALLFFAFFLPWVDISVMSFSGYEIPKIIKSIASIGDFFSLKSDKEISKAVYFAYGLYLIPTLSIAIILVGLTGRNSKILALFTGLLTVGFFVITYNKFEKKLFHIAGIGLYTTLILGFLLFIASFIPYSSQEQNINQQISLNSDEKDDYYVRYRNSQKSNNSILWLLLTLIFSILVFYAVFQLMK